MVVDDVSPASTCGSFSSVCGDSLTVWDGWKGSKKSPLVSLIAGGAAGGVEATVTYRKSAQHPKPKQEFCPWNLSIQDGSISDDCRLPTNNLSSAQHLSSQKLVSSSTTHHQHAILSP